MICQSSVFFLDTFPTGTYKLGLSHTIVASRFCANRYAPVGFQIHLSEHRLLRLKRSSKSGRKTDPKLIERERR